jgi:hypothetical protein
MLARFFTTCFLVASVAIAGLATRSNGAAASESPTQQQQSANPAPPARQLGAIKAVKGTTITLTTDAGADIDVLVEDATRIVRVEPGQKDLKGATLMQLKDLQVGDRILVRGQPSPDAKSMTAIGIIAMKHSDVEAKQQYQREDWQKRGIGGLVSGVDPATGTVTIGVGALGATAPIAVHTTNQTVIRRYAPDSVKFDDAKPGTLDEIKPGDQLRARGNRSAAGSEFAAEEIVTGSFRNIAGTISSIDPAANTVSVIDLIAKKPVIVKLSPESQVRKLPPETAQRIAMRLKASAAGGGAGAPGGAAGAVPQPQPNAPSNSSPSNPTASSATGHGGANPQASGTRSADLQQLLSRMPPATIADLQKGDAVMIVSTEGTASGQVTAITLLAGVEPILTATPRGTQAMMLSPWSLGGGEAGAEANP